MPTPHATAPRRRLTTTPTVVTAALLSGEGVGGDALDLRTADGALLRLPLSRGALAEIAALAAVALREDGGPRREGAALPLAA